jgi:L-aspartate oxidase
MSAMKKTDYLVIGAGIAGLTTAYLLSEFGDVLVITKGKLKQANTYWAQGGIAAVLAKDDSFESHVQNTMDAGVDHANKFAVKYLVENGPKAIRFLESVGVKFNPEPDLEAGHSCARVWRTSDFTGQDILSQLIKATKRQDRITFLEDVDVVELLMQNGECKGAFVRYEDEKELEPIAAKSTILSTGGCGQLFGRTTNTRGSAGDGIAMAVNAGLDLQDMEFIQFHPTALDKPDNSRYFLLSETLRGFGAKVVDHNGEQFLKQFDTRGELAPRDVVSRAIFFELMNGPVYIDMRHLESKEIKARYPNIYKRVKQYGFDLGKDLVPITPVAHYACGGIPVDLKSATDIPGLFAIGEVACTGVHGANRLASNSLLEAVVFSQSAVEAIKKSLPIDTEKSLEIKDIETPTIVMEDIDQVKAYAKRLGQIMWENVGIARTTEGLKKAKSEIMAMPARDYRIQHRQLVCYKIVEACLARHESLGTHYIIDKLT